MSFDFQLSKPSSPKACLKLFYAVCSCKTSTCRSKSKTSRPCPKTIPASSFMSRFVEIRDFPKYQIRRTFRFHVNSSRPFPRFQGKPVDYFVLILEGRVEVIVGRESLMFESGPFTYFGSQALSQSAGVGES